MTVKAVDCRENNSSASFEPGDFCLYAFGKENKSKAVVEVVKVLDDPRGVAQVKFHRFWRMIPVTACSTICAVQAIR